MTRSVSILTRARNGPCCARAIQGAAARAVEKERREIEVFMVISSLCGRKRAHARPTIFPNHRRDLQERSSGRAVVGVEHKHIAFRILQNALASRPLPPLVSF